VNKKHVGGEEKRGVGILSIASALYVEGLLVRGTFETLSGCRYIKA